MTMTETFLQTSVYSPFNHLKRLLAREYLIKIQDHGMGRHVARIGEKKNAYTVFVGKH
jgi:hypothetical protein